MRKYSSRDTYIRDVRFDWTGGGAGGGASLLGS